MRKIVLLSSLLLSQTLFAQQDIHSSFWYKNTVQFNPATPYMGKGFVSLNTRMRMQWLTINGLGMRTNTASVLTKISPQGANGYFTTGVNFYNDQTGNKTINTTSFSIPLNYNMQMDRSTSFSIGFAPTLGSRFVDLSGTWDQQWSGTSFNESLDPGENRTQGSSMYFDIGSGMFYQKYFGEFNYFTLGASVDHLMRPDYVSNLYSTDNMNVRYMLHGGFQISANRVFSYSPQFMASFQAGNYNVIGGVNFIYHLKERSRRLIYEDGIDFTLGTFYRYMDALVLQSTYRNEGFEVGLSYDINISGLTRYTKTVGAVELFLRMNLGSDAQSYSFRRF